MNLIALLQIGLTDAVWSALAAIGFAVLFNAPKRVLLGCALAGAVGHAVRTVLVTSGVSLEFSTLVGAIIVGLTSIVLATHYRVPNWIFTITGAIPLVPGVFAYQTVIGLLNAISATDEQSIHLLSLAAINGIRTALIVSAIAFGTAAPTLLFRR
jgi:uncharacterized membrane protein YjjB (DUF3815 family)